MSIVLYSLSKERKDGMVKSPAFRKQRKGEQMGLFSS